MDNLLNTVLRRAELDPPLFFADEVLRWPSGAIERCLANGMLRPTSPATSLACRECGGDNVCTVVQIRDAAGAMRAFLPCPSCGPVQVPTPRLHRWAVDFERLLDAAFSNIDLRGGRTELVHGRIWSLGRASWHGRFWPVYFGRQLHRQDATALLSQLRLPERSIIFTPSASPHAKSELVIPLGEALVWQGDSLQLDDGYIEDQLPIVDATKKPAKKRSAPRPTRATDIAALTNEMIEHIKAARDHAVMTRDLSGEAQLLPRPSQKELAQRAGVSESSVSRCLKHKAARELRILWELGLDLDQIIGYRSSRSSDRELQLQ